jgi:hypothetical protein
MRKLLGIIEAIAVAWSVLGAFIGMTIGGANATTIVLAMSIAPLLFAIYISSVRRGLKG